jgi:predicted O-linked N-acetylglucosamine transferase (SPINDLY family)
MTVDVALTLLRRGDPDAAMAELDRPNPFIESDADGLTVRGMVLLAQDRPDEARRCLRQAVRRRGAPPATWLNLALAEDRTGHAARAHRLMRALARRLPDWEEPPVRLAESLRAAGAAAEAEAAYRRALAVNPRHGDALIALGGLLILRGEAQEARTWLLHACAERPERAEAWDTLGLAYLASRDPSAARDAFTEAQRLAPAVLDYALHGVEAAVAAGEAEVELARLTSCCAADPANPAILLALGVLLGRQGQRDAAIDALESAAVLAPDAPLPIAFLGGMLAGSTRLREADRALRRAAELDPDNNQISNDHATVLIRLHRPAQARALLIGAIERQGKQQTLLCNLATAECCLGMQDAAVALAREAVELSPGAVLPRRALCNTLPYRHGVTGFEVLTALQTCGATLPRAELPPFANTRDPDRKLAVGLLSGSLKSHPVGWLTVAGCETLDPDAFALVCLVQNALPNDPIGRRYQAIARDWIEVDAVDDVALARLAREQGIDVLIDLGGYGDAARMPACAHRLAPVQVKWVGMQYHSSGLAEMDWFITDRWETPPALESTYSERMLRLPDGYVCYSPPPYAPDPVPLPALRNGHVTFGCFNNLAKVTPVVIETWSRVLRRVPGARLVLKTHQFGDEATAERVRGLFAGHGIAADRLDLRGPSVHRAFMTEYNQIDLVLDPFPYSGGLTTCEALWMGVPTITLPGEIFAARHSVSHLSNAGLPDWVASDLADYVELAVAKASDLEALAALRRRLRAQVKASPLCDAPRFGRSLGAALRHAWRAWCQEEH